MLSTASLLPPRHSVEKVQLLFTLHPKRTSRPMKSFLLNVALQLSSPSSKYPGDHRVTNSADYLPAQVLFHPLWLAADRNRSVLRDSEEWSQAHGSLTCQHTWMQGLWVMNQSCISFLCHLGVLQLLKSSQMYFWILYGMKKKKIFHWYLPRALKTSINTMNESST